MPMYATRAVTLGASGLLLILAGVEIFLCVFTLLVAVGGGLAYYYRWNEENSITSVREVVTFCRDYAVVLSAIFLIRNFAVQHYQVPTGSLEPTVKPIYL